MSLMPYGTLWKRFVSFWYIHSSVSTLCEASSLDRLCGIVP